MPEEEVSYYEIALTSRQVLVTFIVALACVALAFFAGVWVGQQDEGGVDTVADAEAVESDEGAPALGFFTDGDEASAQVEADEPSPTVDQQTAERGRSRPSPPATEAQPDRESPSATATRGTVAPSGSIVLQVLASSNRDTAENTLTSLSEAGHSAYLQSIDRGDATLYRVRVGPFSDRAAAEAAKRRIDHSLHVEALITTAE